MIHNYFIIAFRNLYRKKMYTFINLFGLSVSIAVCIVGYLIWDYSYHFDQFHENAERIYHIGTTRVINEQDQIFGISPLPLAPALARDFSGVKHAVRFANQVAIVRVGDKVFNESIHFADEQFFDMFRFELEQGRYDALKSKTDLIITHDMAMKYFGETNVVGQSITISYANEVKHTYTIGGVLKTIPRNSSLQFGFLLSTEILSDLGVDERNNWSHVTGATFIEVHQAETIQQIKDNESKYIELVRSANTRFPISHLVITPLKDLAIEGENFRSHDLQDAPPPSARITLFITAILLLVMSCFNYMNTSLAMATARLKEIGIRKVMGSPRTQLIFQFLTENVLLCVLAIFAAFGLAEFLVPGWNALFYDIQLSMDESKTSGLWLFLIGLVGLTAVGGGLYPAYVISAHNPAKILQGHQSKTTASWIMKVMLTLQFSVSIIAVVGSVVFSQNAEYQKNLDLGYEPEKLIGVVIQKSSMYPVLSNALMQNAPIESVSAGRNHILYSSWRRTIKVVDRDIEAEFLYVRPGYTETVGLRLAEGRFFDTSKPLDLTESIVINHRMAKEQGWENPIGQTMVIDSVTCRVIGVIEDFYIRGPFRPILPCVFKAAKEDSYRFVIVKADQTNIHAAMHSVEETWKKLFPEMPFDGFYQETQTANAAELSKSIMLVFFCVALMAIVISGMGLFALVSLNIVRRTKEIGIRKVLGASALQIMRMMNSDFIILLLIASVIADVAGFFLFKALLGSIYRYHVEVGITALILANIAVLLIGLATITGRVLKAARANPVNALKYE